jgi:hypothetical protein
MKEIDESIEDKEEYLFWALGDKTLKCKELGTYIYKDASNLGSYRFYQLFFYVTVIPEGEDYIFVLDIWSKGLEETPETYVMLGAYTTVEGIVKSMFPDIGERMLEFLDEYICLKPTLYSNVSLESLRKYLFANTNLRHDSFIRFTTEHVVNAPSRYKAELLKIEEVDTVIQLYELEDLSVLD